MASRFEIVNEEYIEELKDKSQNENMKNNTKWWWKERFQKVGEWKKLASELEEYENDVLD